MVATGHGRREFMPHSVLSEANVSSAADATSHLFFAYLRSLAPEPAGGVQGISQLPRSLQSLLSQTEYPPERPVLMYTTTPRVVMIVESVSPTPFALLRRARNFEYRDDDVALQEFAAYEDPVKALTDECRRVLNAISRTNQSEIIENGTGASKQDPSWSKFEDLGFSGLDGSASIDAYGGGPRAETASLPPGSVRNFGQRGNNIDRPTTPSWADFLSTGFVDERGTSTSTPMLLPPDKVLPPIGEAPRGHSSQSHVRPGPADANLEPGELASINTFELDDTFWWVWMTSLAGEETPVRKAAFGRCALIEANVSGRRWLVIEEQVKGASPGPVEGAYIAEKRSRFSLRGRLSSRKTAGKKTSIPQKDSTNGSAQSKAQRRITIGPDQHASIKAAAAKLKDGNSASGLDLRAPNRLDDGTQSKTHSALTLPPHIVTEAGPAMQWAKAFDRGAIKDDYLNNPNAGKGRSIEPSPSAPMLTNQPSKRDLPALPQAESEHAAAYTAPTAAPESSRPVTPPHRSPSPPMVPNIEKPAISDHPAIRQESTSVGTVQPVDEASRAEDLPPQSSSSPESSKIRPESPSKLKKEKPSGLKKLFTKKEKKGRETQSTTGPPQPIYQQYEESRPVVPGKTSYEPEPMAEPEPEVNREPERDFPDIPEQFQPQRDNEPPMELSRTHTQEERHADTEFARFDQGPLEHVPAFAAPESPVDAAPPPPEFGHPAADVVLRPAPEASPMPTPAAIPESDPLPNVAEEPAEPEERQTDRWAQIRKNAHERAQRMSEEQQSGGQSAGARSHSQSYSKTTDDGDTSGEETIESRVARIKARVAELTGNMESGIAKR